MFIASRILGKGAGKRVTHLNKVVFLTGDEILENSVNPD